MKKFVTLIVMLCTVMIYYPVCHASINHSEDELGFSTTIEYDKSHFLSNHIITSRLALRHKTFEKHWEGLATGTVWYRSNTNKYIIIFFAFLNSINDTFEFDKSRKIVAHVGNQNFLLKVEDYKKHKKDRYVVLYSLLGDMSMTAIVGAMTSTSPTSVYFTLPVKNSPDIIYVLEREELLEWREGLTSYLQEVKRLEDYVDSCGIMYNVPYKI